jgi:hypothetical protein
VRLGLPIRASVITNVIHGRITIRVLALAFCIFCRRQRQSQDIIIIINNNIININNNINNNKTSSSFIARV